MAETNDGGVITEYIIDLLKENIATLQFKALHYGDLRILGAVPAICVEPAQATFTYNQTGTQTLNEFTVSVIIYHTGRTGVEGSQRHADTTTQKVKDVINKDIRSELNGGTRFDGLLTSGLVSRIEYDYRVLADEAMRANRIIFEGESTTTLVIT